MPKQNHSKLLRKIAQVAITAPMPPIAVPSQKPGRRPIRAISVAPAALTHYAQRVIAAVLVQVADPERRDLGAA